LLCIDDLVAATQPLHLLDKIASSAWSITLVAIPQRNQRKIRIAGRVIAAFGERVVEHPQIISLPDTVVFLTLQPCGQVIFVIASLCYLAEYANLIAIRMGFEKFPESVDPVTSCFVD
jgi:hypothetical protein